MRIFILLKRARGGLNQSCSQGLNLGQLPGLGGSMMSMVAACESVGAVLGISLGGFMLIWFGWGVLGGLLGVFGVLGFLILNFFALEPGS